MSPVCGVLALILNSCTSTLERKKYLIRIWQEFYMLFGKAIWLRGDSDMFGAAQWHLILHSFHCHCVAIVAVWLSWPLQEPFCACSVHRTNVLVAYSLLKVRANIFRSSKKHHSLQLQTLSVFSLSCCFTSKGYLFVITLLTVPYGNNILVPSI